MIKIKLRGPRGRVKIVTFDGDPSPHARRQAIEAARRAYPGYRPATKPVKVRKRRINPGTTLGASEYSKRVSAGRM